MKFFISLLLAVLSSFFIACSSGNSNGGTHATSVTGQFIDDPVQGLDYNCSSGTTGVTNSNGQYTCPIGDDVTFSLGSLTIGRVAAQQNFVTPYSLFPNDTQAIVNFARLLQSIDADGNKNNGIIQLDAAQVALLSSDTNFSDPNFVTKVETDMGITLVPSEDALNHLNDAIVLNGEDVPEGGHIPQAKAGTDKSIIVDTSIILDGTASVDADGDSLTYQWSLISVPQDSNHAIFNNLTTARPSLTPDVEGSFIIKLIVNDGVVNSAADVVTITATRASSADLTPLPLNWVREIMAGLKYNNPAAGIGFDSDKNLYVAGNTLTNSQAGHDYTTLEKFDVNGISQWREVVGNSHYTHAQSMLVDQNNSSVYIVGVVVGGDELNSKPTIGDKDIFILKFDFDANLLWTVVDGTVQTDQPFDMALDSSGNIYITGYTLGDFDGTSAKNRDIFIAKYDSNGNLKWKRQLHEDAAQNAYGITVDSSDNIFITGRASDDTDHTGVTFDGHPIQGHGDIFVLKYDTNGSKLWSQLLGTVENEAGFGIATDTNDSVYIVGYTKGDLDGHVSLGTEDPFILKYDTNGTLILSNQMSSDKNEVFYKLIIDSNGLIYTSGYITLSTNPIRFNYTLTKFNPAIQELWSLHNGTDKYTEQGYFITLDSAENVYVNGSTSGEFPGSDTATANEIFIARYENNISSGPYSVGGVTSNSIGTFTITNNGGDDLILQDNGTFTFSTKLPNGAGYNVEIVQGSDTSQGQQCFISGGSNGDGSGTINNADVVDINISCAGV